MIKLEVQNKASHGKRLALKSVITVGTAEGNTIRIKNDKIKPKHARFFIDNGKNYVELLDTDGNVLVNRNDILHSELRHEDMVQIGPLRLRVVDESIESAAQHRLDALLDATDDNDNEELIDFATEDLFYLTSHDPSLRQAVGFKLPSKDRYIEQAQQFVSRLARESGMDEMKCEAFMTCTKELILNAHRHGHKYDEAKTIIIRYRDMGDALRLQIEDEGEGFDHEAALSGAGGKSAAEAARERYQAGGFGGLGFQMIVRMSDSIEYNDAGNIVTFVVSKDF